MRLALLAACVLPCATERRPNVLLTVVDDLGYADIGYNAQGKATALARATPNLDKLAAEGVKLRSFYASPECTPTRAMLLTGRHTVHTGLQDSVIHGTEPRGVPLAEETIATRLRRRGYTTSCIGKWHLGFHQPQYLPRARGFDRFFGILNGGGNHYSHVTTEAFVTRGNATATHTVTGRNLWRDDAPLDEATAAALENTHTTALYTREAKRQLEGGLASGGMLQARSFFMYLAYQAVHGPVQADPAFYSGAVDNGCADISASATAHTDPDVSWSSRQRMCAMVSMVDYGVGQVTDALRTATYDDDGSAAWDNTVLLFLSDNGGVKRHGSSNAPFRGEKGVYFEGGVRVVAFVGGGYTARAMAAYGSARASVDMIAHVTDFHATALALATGDIADDDTTMVEAVVDGSASDAAGDGVDLWAALTRGARAPRNEVLINRNSLTWGGGGALRRGRWKLIVENSVGDSVLYRAGQAYLARRDYTPAALLEQLDARRADVFPEPNYYLFDLRANPSEDDASTCVDGVTFANAEAAASCSNLWSLATAAAAASQPVRNTSYAALAASARAELLQSWESYADGMAESNEEWIDDGPLADPALLDGVWGPWRDENGMPYATYGLLSEAQDL